MNTNEAKQNEVLEQVFVKPSCARKTQIMSKPQYQGLSCAEILALKYDPDKVDILRRV